MNEEYLSGTELKIFTYEEWMKPKKDSSLMNQTNIQGLVDKLFQKIQNCLIINIEKDTERYRHTINELKKVSIENFVHLKATYWKDRIKFKNDLNVVTNFLRQFHPDMPSGEVLINEFSEPSDPNIKIQDGPLACYCSHLRAMIYGYQNFKDYTIIVEDDIKIANVDNIDNYLKQIPADWDIVFLNSVAKNKTYDKPFYKFEEQFHSAHFYIINHKCFPFLFQNLYPVTDQVDVLMSDLFRKLNMYNIPETVYQRNVSTNTQNNLHTIFNSKHYNGVRSRASKTIILLDFFINNTLKENLENNRIILKSLMYDVIYEYILSGRKVEESKPNVESYRTELFVVNEYDKYVNQHIRNDLINSIHLFIQSGRKGIDTEKEAECLVNNLLYTIQKFELHNTKDVDYNEKLKAYSFGSTCHVYLLKNNNVVVKRYNDKFRWTTKGHEDSMLVFEKEIEILKKLKSKQFNHFPELLSHCLKTKTIKMSYGGESLYNEFKLPKDWKKQIKMAFDDLDKKGILYPEFRLQNILVKDGKLTLVDFGLAEINSNKNNKENYKNFIKNLDVLNKKLSQISDIDKRHQLCRTFMANIDTSAWA